MTPRPPRVLSVVGPGRSGTTLLGNILGEVPGVANGGEMRWLWRRGLGERRPCGCGLPPARCPRWSAVLDLLRPTWLPAADDEVPAAVGRIVAAQGEVLARRNRLRAISAAGERNTGWEALRCLRAVTVDLCTALAEVTGAGLVVDTSKQSAVAALFAAVDEVDHHVLYVMRDPRAVAYSWQRPKALPVSGGTATMATMSPVASVGLWWEDALGAELLRRHIPRDRLLLVRYEDFVARPKATVDRVLAFAGLASPGPFVSPDTVELGTNHTISGNPNRFRTGAVRITDDDEWKSRLPARDRIVITAAALPLLRRYAYPVRLSG